MRDHIQVLKKQLHNSCREQRVDLLNKLSENPVEISLEQCLSYAIEALSLSKELSYERGEALALKNLGLIYIYLGNCSKSIDYSLKALRLLKNNKDSNELCLIFTNIGTAYGSLSDYDKALHYYFKAVSYAEKANNRAEIGNCFRKIGIIYWCLEDYSNSLNFCEKALPIHEDTNNFAGIASVCITIGLAYTHFQEYNKAIDYYNRAYTLSKEHNIADVKAASIINIGYTNYKLNNYDDALHYYKESLKLYEQIGYKVGIATSLLFMGNLFLDTKNYSDALNYLEKSLSIAQEVNIKKVISDIYLAFSNYYEINEDYKNSLYFFKLHSEVKYSMFAETFIKKINKIKTNFELEHKEKELYRLKTVQLTKSNMQLQLTNEKINQKNEALEKSNKKLEKIAKTDYLTNLWNRMYIIEKINEEINLFRETKDPFVLVIADIDFFKQFNDKYGHTCGDTVLVYLAKDICKMLRPSDCIARWGGEEFLMLLPSTSLEEGYRIANNIRERISSKTYKYNNYQLTITLTFGVFEYTKEMSIENCLNLVDTALYKGKNTTRNCIVKVTG